MIAFILPFVFAGFGQGKGFNHPGSNKANARTSVVLEGGGGTIDPATATATSSVVLALT